MATPLPIDERLETAGHLVVRARIFYDVWWFYEGADTRPKIIDAMNDYPEFFRFDSHAHFVAFVVHIAALFERRNDTINLPMLISEFATSNLVPAGTIAEAESIFSEACPLIPKVIILRSNLFAHRSATLTYAKVFEKADITANQLGHLCELALRIVNRLLLARGLGESSSTRFRVAMLRECSMLLPKCLPSNPTRTRGKRRAEWNHRSRAPVGVNVGRQERQCR